MGTYQPYNFLNENQEMDGFDADIAKEIAKGLDVDIEFVSQEFSGMIAGLKANKFDMVVSQMTITEDRKKEMLFSDPYITNQVKVIVSEKYFQCRFHKAVVGRFIVIRVPSPNSLRRDTEP